MDLEPGPQRLSSRRLHRPKRSQWRHLSLCRCTYRAMARLPSHRRGIGGRAEWRAGTWTDPSQGGDRGYRGWSLVSMVSVARDVASRTPRTTSPLAFQLRLLMA